MLVVSVALGVFRNVVAFFVIRVLQGLAIASFYPAAASLVGDMAPVERRGELLGYFSIFLNLGVALGPGLGEVLFAWKGFGAVCAAGAAISACGLVAVSRIHDDRPAEPPASPPPLISREALFPGVVNGLAATAYAAASSFVPLWALRVGMMNSGLFFLIFAGCIVAVRPFTGRMSDRRGRRFTVIPGLFLCGAAMLVLPLAPSRAGILAAGATFGLAWGLLIPGITAFALDRAPEAERGSAMGTFTAFVDLGIGGGAWLIGALVQAFGYRTSFVLISLLPFSAFVLFTVRTRAVAPAPARPR